MNETKYTHVNLVRMCFLLACTLNAQCSAINVVIQVLLSFSHSFTSWPRILRVMDGLKTASGLQLAPETGPLAPSTASFRVGLSRYSANLAHLT